MTPERDHAHLDRVDDLAVLAHQTAVEETRAPGVISSTMALMLISIHAVLPESMVVTSCRTAVLSLALAG